MCWIFTAFSNTLIFLQQLFDNGDTTTEYCKNVIYTADTENYSEKFCCIGDTVVTEKDYYGGNAPKKTISIQFPSDTVILLNGNSEVIDDISIISGMGLTYKYKHLLQAIDDILLFCSTHDVSLSDKLINSIASCRMPILEDFRE